MGPLLLISEAVQNKVSTRLSVASMPLVIIAVARRIFSSAFVEQLPRRIQISWAETRQDTQLAEIGIFVTMRILPLCVLSNLPTLLAPSQGRKHVLSGETDLPVPR